MTTSKTIRTLFSLLIAIILFAGVWSPAMAQDDGEDQALAAGFVRDFVRGKSGIHVPSGFDPDVLNLTSSSGFERSTLPGGFRIGRAPVTINLDSDGLMPFTYIFFELWPWQRRAFENGDLTIAYRNSSGTWVECPSFMVNDGDDDDDGEGNFRIACVAPMPTSFAIGTFDESAIPSILP